MSRRSNSSTREKRAQAALNGLDDDPAPSASAAVNGTSSNDLPARHSQESPLEQELREKLERMSLEKETLEGQYRTLLERLSEMKSRIGQKLQEDAEELERRETLITQLTSQTEDLQSTITSLSSELTSSNDESSRLTKEMDTLRQQLHSTQAAAQTSLSSELSNLSTENTRLRDLSREKDDLLERAKLEKEEWERVLVEERLAAETLRMETRTMRRELETAQSSRRMAEKALEDERQRADNLESVLGDFESSQDSSLQSLKAEYNKQVDGLTNQLAEYKSRALNAEATLDELKGGKSPAGGGDSKRVEELEKEVKEKTVLLSKVRQEAVTLNEHLIQALRRLRKYSTDPSLTTSDGKGAKESYVDRRLVTNILLQFLATPRADRKRFEMLSLLGSILGWGDEERERAGLQRGSGGVSPIGSGAPPTPRTKVNDVTNDESFSKMWVEFLLKEASQGSSSTSSTVYSPSASHHASSPSLFGGSQYAQSSYTQSQYAPSAYAQSNYAKSSYAPSEGHPSPPGGVSNLPPLPPLPEGRGANGGSSRAFRLPSLSKTRDAQQ